MKCSLCGSSGQGDDVAVHGKWGAVQRSTGEVIAICRLCGEGSLGIVKENTTRAEFGCDVEDCTITINVHLNVVFMDEAVHIEPTVCK